MPKPRLSLEVQDVGDGLPCQSKQADFGKIRLTQVSLGHFTQTVNVVVETASLVNQV